jgi:hypothetical protein
MLALSNKLCTSGPPQVVIEKWPNEQNAFDCVRVVTHKI